jgi:hypothetical protein
VKDPAALLIGAGGIGVVAAASGALAALTTGDAPADPDRVRVATTALELSPAGGVVLDERHPPVMLFRFAPTWYFPDGGGRLRLFGHVGGLLGQDVEVDPRPQHSTPIEGQEGTFPFGLGERRLNIGVGLDMAVLLPYPVLSASRFLGPAELRYKPEVQITRHVFEYPDGQTRIVERVMLLPLTAGIRWHVSPRQRFTLYVGPRFDFVSYSEPGGGLARGAAQLGPFYGEAWYDIDVPITLLVRGARPSKVQINGQVTMGYVHSRFDGRGFNISGAIGFMGPIQVAWAMRFRPTGARWALQGTVGTWIGNGLWPFAQLGLVLPDLGGRRR